MKKRVLIIILAAVVVIGLGLGAFKIYSDQQKMTDEIVDLLFKGKSVSQFQIDSMLEGEYKIGEKYLKIKDTEKFRARIYEEVKAFLEEHSDAVNFDFVHEKLALVEQEGLLTDEAKQLIEEFEVNAAKEYKVILDEALESKDYEKVARTLYWIAEKKVADISGLDINAVLDNLLENCQIYSLQNNTGAYYDDIELKSSSSYRNEGVEWMDPIGYTSRSYVETAYGDFCIGTSHSKTHYEALEGYDFENKYNTEETSKRLYLRGREVEGHFWSDSLKFAANNGAKFLFCYENESDDADVTEIETDGILMIADNKLYIMGYYSEFESGDTSIYIEGDFSDYVKETKKVYSEKYSSQVDIEKTQKLVDEKKYEEAMDILQYYTHIEGGLDTIYSIAVESMRQGNTEFALKTLEHIPYYEPIKDLDMDYMIKNLDSRFDSDVNHTEYTKPFLKLMSDVNGYLTDEDITTALSDKNFKEVSAGNYSFSADGTGYQKKGGNTYKFTWEVKDGQLIKTYEGNPKPSTYSVSNVLPNYYLLTYTGENSDKLYMTLLKAN